MPDINKPVAINDEILALYDVAEGYAKDRAYESAFAAYKKLQEALQKNGSASVDYFHSRFMKTIKDSLETAKPEKLEYLYSSLIKIAVDAEKRKDSPIKVGIYNILAERASKYKEAETAASERNYDKAFNIYKNLQKALQQSNPALANDFHSTFLNTITKTLDTAKLEDLAHFYSNLMRVAEDTPLEDDIYNTLIERATSTKYKEAERAASKGDYESAFNIHNILQKALQESKSALVQDFHSTFIKTIKATLDTAKPENLENLMITAANAERRDEYPVAVDIYNMLAERAVSKKDYEKAFNIYEHLQEALQESDILDLQHLPDFHSTFMNTIKASLDTAKPGDLERLYSKIAVNAESRKDYPLAVEIYSMLSEKGFVAATTRLAHLYSNGLGVMQDKVKASELLVMASVTSPVKPQSKRLGEESTRPATTQARAWTLSNLARSVARSSKAEATTAPQWAAEVALPTERPQVGSARSPFSSGRTNVLDTTNIQRTLPEWSPGAICKDETTNSSYSSHSLYTPLTKKGLTIGIYASKVASVGQDAESLRAMVTAFQTAHGKEITPEFTVRDAAVRDALLKVCVEMGYKKESLAIKVAEPLQSKERETPRPR